MILPCTLFDNGAMTRALLIWFLAVQPALLGAEVLLERDGDRIAVSIGGQPFTAFFFGSDATKPYLHPLRATDGTVITRGYPMAEIAGEQRDHPHHRGLWFSHGDVNGVDFWANEESQRTRGEKGTIALDAIDTVQSGEDEGLIKARFSWKGAGGNLLVTEHRTMAFRREAEDNIVDFDIVLVAEVAPVRFGDTKEGTFAVRMATELEEQHLRAKGIPRTGRIANAEGRTTEANAWGQRSAWVDYSGSISGKPMGVAIFDHPGNPKHPSYWHVRGYGLFAANIFGEHDFHADESRDGSITLERARIFDSAIASLSTRAGRLTRTCSRNSKHGVPPAAGRTAAGTSMELQCGIPEPASRHGLTKLGSASPSPFAGNSRIS